MLKSILEYFPDLTERQINQLTALNELYFDWNQKINVISRKDIENLYLHHVLYSLAIAKIVQFIPGTKILDLGTGGGFPGIPLAILFPDTDFLLVDSIGKKIKVVKDIAEHLGLLNITVSNDRVEKINGKFDFVVSRAVDKLDIVWGWSQPKLIKVSQNQIANGLLYLRGGDISNDLPIGVKIKSWDIGTIFREEYFSDKKILHIFES